MTKKEAYELYSINAAAFMFHIKIDGKEPNELLMREIEEACGVPVEIAADFRHFILASYRASELLEDKKLLENHNCWWVNEFFENSLQQYADKH